MKAIRIDFEKNEVVMTRKFAAAASDPHTKEYKILQDVLNTYEGINVRRHTIKKNPNKECYKGLTYDYMREYIRSHEAKANVESALAELEDMIYISKCHSNGFRYPTIKKWFLDKYKEVAEFGTELNESEERRTVGVEFPNQDNITAA